MSDRHEVSSALAFADGGAGSTVGTVACLEKLHFDGACRGSSFFESTFGPLVGSEAYLPPQLSYLNASGLRTADSEVVAVRFAGKVPIYVSDGVDPYNEVVVTVLLSSDASARDTGIRTPTRTLAGYTVLAIETDSLTVYSTGSTTLTSQVTTPVQSAPRLAPTWNTYSFSYHLKASGGCMYAKTDASGTVTGTCGRTLSIGAKVPTLGTTPSISTCSSELSASDLAELVEMCEDITNDAAAFYAVKAGGQGMLAGASAFVGTVQPETVPVTGPLAAMFTFGAGVDGVKSGLMWFLGNHCDEALPAINEAISDLMCKAKDEYREGGASSGTSGSINDPDGDTNGSTGSGRGCDSVGTKCTTVTFSWDDRSGPSGDGTYIVQYTCVAESCTGTTGETESGECACVTSPGTSTCAQSDVRNDYCGDAPVSP